MSNLEEKKARVAKVNEFVGVIASCGRRFFHRDENERYYERCARALVDGDTGKVAWFDEHGGLVNIIDGSYRWKNFSHGGTLRALVIRLRKYINDGMPLMYWEPEATGRHWGYGKDMAKVVASAVELGIMSPPPASSHGKTDAVSDKGGEKA